jgi:hypothetical protein
MPDSLRPWTIPMLGAGGLFVGGLAWYAWERVWIWRRLDLCAFAVDGKTLTTDGRFVGMKEAVGGRSWIDEMLGRPPGSGVRHLR